MNIVQPSTEQVNFYKNKWNSPENEKYVLQESSLRKLFTETYPLNVEMDDVLIKVCSLNDFYSTNIFNPFAVAQHIVDLNIDQHLSNQDITLVNKIATVQVTEQTTKDFFSFATKYCSHHNPDFYPIYDKYVVKMLMHFKRVDKFAKFRKVDLRCFQTFRNVLMQFSRFYKIDSFKLREIDVYLWQAGKHYFQ